MTDYLPHRWPFLAQDIFQVFERGSFNPDNNRCPNVSLFSAMPLVPIT